jgi:DNA-binding NarL/FixJ family response regulator
MLARILIVDRDPRYAEWLRHHLGVTVPDANVGVLDYAEFERLRESLTHDDCDLMLLTASFGSSPEDNRAEGINLLRELRARATFPALLAVAEDGNELTAVRALQLGALDYLPKRLLTPDRLKTAVKLALRRIERRVARRMAKLSQTGNNGEGNDAPEAPAAPPIPPKPDLIPGYTIRALIGESEKAIVYLAASEALGREVALKVATAEESGSDDHHLLEREYAAISTIRHPAIVELYDYGVHGGREYLAMEYFARGDLKARLQMGLTEAEALRYVEHIASALRVVHHAGILHRDLKPPNVMLRENDDIALIDFGLARNLEGGLQSTRTGVLRGSPYYMSPEQALGEELDSRTDLYSLGIIFYEMLTGRKPFSGSSAIEVLQEHVNTPVPRLPEAFAHHQPLLSRMLAKARDERFASAEEVIEAVAAARNAREPQSSAA